MTIKPEITKTTTEVNKCAHCGTPCYWQAVCSACQVGALVEAMEHKTWSFGHVAMWAKRLYSNISQDVEMLHVEVVAIQPTMDKYTITINFMDGSDTEAWATYWHTLTKEQAKRLEVKLLAEGDTVSLNGLHWGSI